MNYSLSASRLTTAGAAGACSCHGRNETAKASQPELLAAVQPTPMPAPVFESTPGIRRRARSPHPASAFNRPDLGVVRLQLSGREMHAK